MEVTCIDDIYRRKATAKLLAAQIALPFSACGLVIGKGGSVQKEIVDKTGHSGLDVLRAR